MTLSRSPVDRSESDSGFAVAVRVQPLRIGPLVVDPPLLQAPMAGFTNYAYRQVVREFGGVGLQATEMVSARNGTAACDVRIYVTCPASNFARA